MKVLSVFIITVGFLLVTNLSSGQILAVDLPLPVVAQCDKIAGPNCDQDICSVLPIPLVNSCPLSNPQNDGVTDVSCLEFENEKNANAAWTLYDDLQSVSTSSLAQYVKDPAKMVDIGDSVFLGTGSRRQALSEIADRFFGEGDFTTASGIDRYEPFDGISDSWVVPIALASCDANGGRCEGGNPETIVDFACFEIREISLRPKKQIRGQFLCDSDPLYLECFQ